MSTNGQTAAGVTVPDTKLAREATELVRESTTDLVYHHSRRVFWFGSLQGRNRGLSFDPELLYIGAMFHDLGLNSEFRGSGRRFEVDSADEARPAPTAGLLAQHPGGLHRRHRAQAGNDVRQR
jgi:hypothetical protein